MNITLWRFDGPTSPSGAGWDTAITSHLEAAGATVTTIDPYRDDPFVHPADGHVLSGGATPVAATPGATRALEHARRLVALDPPVPVVGICLGAQTLAAAITDPTIIRHTAGIEVGIVTIHEPDGTSYNIAAFHPDDIDPTFADHPEITVTASNSHSPIQAFSYPPGLPTVHGVQCHPELDPAALADAVRANTDWVGDPDPIIQKLERAGSLQPDRIYRWLLEPLGLPAQ